MIDWLHHQAGLVIILVVVGILVWWLATDIGKHPDDDKPDLEPKEEDLDRDYGAPW